MKCANEMKEIRAIANLTHEAEEKAKAIAAYAKACAATVDLCENRIGTMLEKKAHQHGNEQVTISFPIEFAYNRLGNRVFKMVTEHPHVYANGGSSWEPSGEEYSYETLVKYLAKFCYATTIKECDFRVKRYCFGDYRYSTIEITTAPECE